jgi:hypothetical protein
LCKRNWKRANCKCSGNLLSKFYNCHFVSTCQQSKNEHGVISNASAIFCIVIAEGLIEPFSILRIWLCSISAIAASVRILNPLDFLRARSLSPKAFFSLSFLVIYGKGGKIFQIKCRHICTNSIFPLFLTFISACLKLKVRIFFNVLISLNW